MIKVLRAYGSPGKSEDSWNFNWCTAAELVGYFGITCTSSDYRCHCGCGISFTGLDSGRATTRARVEEMEEEEFEERLAKFRSKMTGWWSSKLYEDYRQWCVDSLRLLSQDLEHYKPGQVLGIEKKPQLRLIPQTLKE